MNAIDRATLALIDTHHHGRLDILCKNNALAPHPKMWAAMAFLRRGESPEANLIDWFFKLLLRPEDSRIIVRLHRC